MSNEEIEKFFDKQQVQEGQQVKIEFKKRDSIYGIFITTKDYADLKAKNFWRIVTSLHFDAWRTSKDVNLAKIFNGSDFSRLVVKDIKAN